MPLSNYPDDGLFSWSRKPAHKFSKGLLSTDGPYQDPTALGFQFLFDYVDVPGSPLLIDAEDVPGTAMAYLKSIGDTKRMAYLKKFIEILRMINKDSPWYWQSVEGVNEALITKSWEGSGGNAFMGGADKPITINCLESIDLKITGLMELYRQAAYDMRNRRAILPENLRKFRAYLWISEVRKIKTPSTDAVGGADLKNVYPTTSEDVSSESNPSAQPSPATTIKAEEQKKTKNFQENLPFIFLKFDFCEWDIDNGHLPLETLTFASPEFASNKIKFTFGNVTEPASVFMPQLLDLPVGDKDMPNVDSETVAGQSAQTGAGDPGQPGSLAGAGTGAGGNAFGAPVGEPSFLDSFVSQVQDNLALGVFEDLPSPAQILETGVQNLTAAGANLVTGYLNNLLLGNVYEFNLTDLRSTLQGASANSLIQTVKDELGLSQTGTSGGGPNVGDNVYGSEGPGISGPPPQERLFDPAGAPTNLDGNASPTLSEGNTFADSTAQPSPVLGLESLFTDVGGSAPLSQENILPDEDGSAPLSDDNVYGD